MGGSSSQPTPVPVPPPTTPAPPPITPEPGANDPNPYASQTSANTRTGWAGSQTPTSVDIEGIGDYAADIMHIGDFYRSREHLNLISDALTKSWTDKGLPLPEAIYASTHLSHNLKEFAMYLHNLNDAMGNIAMAAQTIADCYLGTDGWSATDVNAVDFAFGDKVPKPSGWLFTTDKTFADATAGQQSSQSSVWTTSSLKTDDNGTTTTVSTDQFGNTMTTIVRKAADGSTVTSICAPDGTWTTTSSVPQGNGTLVTTTTLKIPYLPTVTTVLTQNTADGSVTTTSVNGKVKGMTTVVRKEQVVPGGTAQVVTTTETDGNGKPIHSTVETTYHVNGQSGTVIMTYDKDGNLLSELQLGAPTATTGGDTTVQQIDANIDNRNVPPPSPYDQFTNTPPVA